MRLKNVIINFYLVYKKRNYKNGNIFEKLILEVKKNARVSIKISFET